MTQSRLALYFRYRVEQGAIARWGPNWASDNPERVPRLEHETVVIVGQGFDQFFLILAQIMQWMRDQKIVYGPGRGSVGGSLVAYCLQIHEIDPLEFELSFERFLNPERIAYPDVDLDVSQRHRHRVLQWIKETFEDEHTVVLQVAAFARAGARSTIDLVAAAKRLDDPNAESIAVQLKRLLPEGANVTGGTKQPHEIAWWLENNKNKSSKNNRNVAEFREIAIQAGWMDALLKLDGIQTHLAKHAAGVVIVSREDLKRLPQTGARDSQTQEWRMMTGYDMYSLDDLKYLKIDILGLRTLDIVSDAHQFCGGSGATPDLVKLWNDQRNVDTGAYDLLCAADTTGVFQVETSGYRRTLKDFQPRSFEHIMHLNALYRPGALDAVQDDGRNMVDIFIDRLHEREPITYPDGLHDILPDVLGETQGIIIYQEQAMKLAQMLAGFSGAEADNLRKAIGKKQLDRMALIKPKFYAGVQSNGYPVAVADQVWKSIDAASRYSWNKSHSAFYSMITWWTAYFKGNKVIDLPDLGLQGSGTTAFYAALINSLDGDKDRQADAVAEARQHVEIRPPDINVAMESYTVQDKAIVFGLNGIKGMGAANRQAIILDRMLFGPFKSFEDFHRRLPSVPINMKLALIQCGAFDLLGRREMLLATVPKRNAKGEANGKVWTIAEFIKHNCGLKKPRPLPDITEWVLPSAKEIADGEMNTIGFYVTADPMADVTEALKRLDPSCHWGGEIIPSTIKIKNDRKGNEMCMFTLLTSSLNKQRCLIFASNWEQCKPLVLARGKHVVVRGELDGTLKVDKIFGAGDYRQFRNIYLTGNGSTKVEVFDGQFETIEMAEASGYEVRLR